mmetsp:Transcript_15441/g.58444  ORF Transcript_15441/g.58444 Transcript_15441/m.58444 type:complete len:238 (+) Transcript_15441:2324-3037(+)
MADLKVRTDPTVIVPFGVHWSATMVELSCGCNVGTSAALPTTVKLAPCAGLVGCEEYSTENNGRILCPDSTRDATRILTLTLRVAPSGITFRRAAAAELLTDSTRTPSTSTLSTAYCDAAKLRSTRVGEKASDDEFASWKIEKITSIRSPPSTASRGTSTVVFESARLGAVKVSASEVMLIPGTRSDVKLTVATTEDPATPPCTGNLASMRVASLTPREFWEFWSVQSATTIVVPST